MIQGHALTGSRISGRLPRCLVAVAAWACQAKIAQNCFTTNAERYDMIYLKSRDGEFFGRLAIRTSIPVQAADLRAQ
jgi:hypothetical protein